MKKTFLVTVLAGLIVEIAGYIINQGELPALIVKILPSLAKIIENTKLISFICAVIVEICYIIFGRKDEDSESGQDHSKFSNFLARVPSAIFIAVATGIILIGVGIFVPPSPKPTPEVSETPGPGSAPSEGLSTVSTMLRDIYYDGGGKVLALSENIDGTWVKWDYCYDSAGGFLYRLANIGTVESKLSPEHMPGTDVSYSVLSTPIDNCISFTLKYQLTDLWSGDGLGNRNVYIFNGQNWIKVATFSYDSYESVSVPITLDNPMTIERFTTPRVFEDDYT